VRTLFVDTAYFVAILNPQDDLHGRAIVVSRALDDCIFVTSEMILTEVLNFFAERGRSPRRLAANFVLQLRQDPNTRIVPQTSAQFEDGFGLYRSFSDKEWSHTDCVSSGLCSKKTLLRHLPTIIVSSKPALRLCSGHK
jgi:uncharacterized protein